MPANHSTRPRLIARIREELFTMLGPNCARCGCDLNTTAWEVNHIAPRDWRSRETGSYNRWLRYRREAQARRVNLMCKDCNAVYRPSWEALETHLASTTNEPF